MAAAVNVITQRVKIIVWETSYADFRSFSIDFGRFGG